MVLPNLDNIIKKVRRYLALGLAQQISDQDIIDAINTYYLWNLPQNLKLLSLEQRVSFYTQPNVDVYAFDTDNYYDVQPLMMIAGYSTQLLQSVQQFFYVWPKVKYQQQVGSGDGSTGIFNVTISSGTPFLRSFPGNKETEVLISCPDVNGNVMLLVDVPTSPSQGNLYDPNTNIVYGTVNYLNGICSFSFPSNTLAGGAIYAQTTPYVAARPQTCLFFQDQFTLRPVPSTAYEVVYTALVKPTQFLATNLLATPEIQEWWELLAAGGARILFQERMDENQLGILEPIYQEKLRNIERRTLTQLGNQQAATIFNSPPGFNFALYNALGGTAT